MENLDIYQKRRRTLGNTYSRTLFVISSGTEAKRSHSVKYRFKPAADFSYLCGLHLANALLLILGKKTYVLFDQHDDKVWGENTVLTENEIALTKEITFASVDRLDEIVRSHLADFDRIAASLDRDQNLDSALLKTISYDRKLKNRIGAPLAIVDSRTLVGTVRHLKDQTEISAMKEAGLRSSMVHKMLMQQSLVGKTERQVANWIEGHFLLEEMQWTAYETIVGSGERSTLLHARASDKIIQDGDMLVVDAGGEWQGYCADITRTLSASGTFSFQQKEIYQAVLTAQKTALASIKPGTSLQDIHELTLCVLTEELLRLNLSKDLVHQHIKDLMPHGTSHWLGMDVHDPSPYIDDSGSFIRLAEGMTFTVEPGLYFRRQDLFTEYHGIGVRIEDNVLVTASGYELFSSAPKELEEIEQLRRKK